MVSASKDFVVAIAHYTTTAVTSVDQMVSKIARSHSSTTVDLIQLLTLVSAYTK